MSARHDLIDLVRGKASHGALRRDPQKAGGKSNHNRARYLVNLVIEAASPNADKYSTEEILKTALFLAKGPQP